MDAKPYHHGDLRAALLAAAELELAERGVEAFSLRAVAKRAGVSHAAPAHHFGDGNGLLTALAAEGFRQFLASQQARQALADADARSQIMAAGLGYVDFAMARPALFRLIFSSRRPDYRNVVLLQQAEAALSALRSGVAAAGGDVMDVSAVWATAHGLADLLASGRLLPVAALPGAQRDAALLEILGRALRRP